MFKQVSLMKRHPSLTMDEFIDRYENHHAKFGEKLFKKARRFVRRYVHPEVNPLTGEVVELDFDVVMELWWDSRADFEAAMKMLAESDLVDQIRASGETLFVPSKNRAFTVTEYDSDLG
jgi:hypothetical protein